VQVRIRQVSYLCVQIAFGYSSENVTACRPCYLPCLLPLAKFCATFFKILFVILGICMVAAGITLAGVAQSATTAFWYVREMLWREVRSLSIRKLLSCTNASLDPSAPRYTFVLGRGQGYLLWFPIDFPLFDLQWHLERDGQLKGCRSLCARPVICTCSTAEAYYT
jgi:hypothetical protein